MEETTHVPRLRPGTRDHRQEVLEKKKTLNRRSVRIGVTAPAFGRDLYVYASIPHDVADRVKETGWTISVLTEHALERIENDADFANRVVQRARTLQSSARCAISHLAQAFDRVTSSVLSSRNGPQESTVDLRAEYQGASGDADTGTERGGIPVTTGRWPACADSQYSLARDQLRTNGVQRVPYYNEFLCRTPDAIDFGWDCGVTAEAIASLMPRRGTPAEYCSAIAGILREVFALRKGVDPAAVRSILAAGEGRCWHYRGQDGVWYAKNV